MAIMKFNATPGALSLPQSPAWDSKAVHHHLSIKIFVELIDCRCDQPGFRTEVMISQSDRHTRCARHSAHLKITLASAQLHDSCRHEPSRCCLATTSSGWLLGDHLNVQ